MSRLFCFGLGYTAQALARQALAAGWTVAGTARTREGVDALKNLGFEGLLFDGEAAAPDVAAWLASATQIVVSAPPDARGDPVLRVFGEQIAAVPSLAWVGYLSTVGVYGNTHGDWVDESRAVAGDHDRTRWRIAAERRWLDSATASRRVQVFRLAGIYGPGRSALDSVRSGRAQRIVKPGQVFNRVHVEDIAQGVMAAMTGRGEHDIYNVADDEPAPPQDVIAFAAELLGAPPLPDVPFETAELSPMARSFYTANRRVSNARLKGDLGVRLRYRNYREGLRGIFASGA